MIVTNDAIKLLHKYEGLVLDAYLCPAKIPTIGYGNTFYEDGSKVKMGDKITKERAIELFENVLENNFASQVKRLIKSRVTNNQFSALVSFAYNVGVGNLKRSTLLKLVNSNPNDPAIRNQFMRWNRAGGKVLLGLTRRRESEADLYFK
jgi:lysozyme